MSKNAEKIIIEELNNIINDTRIDIKADDSRCLKNPKFKKILLWELGFCRDCPEKCFKESKEIKNNSFIVLKDLELENQSE